MTVETMNQTRWEALRKRDASAEGTFIYAVLTTGVYCRPTCPARRPHFENVRFFSSNADAEKAGYRACKRCKPNQPDLATRNADAITKAVSLIGDADSTPDLAAIATRVGMSRHHFHRTFRAIMGMTPGAYVNSLREQRVVQRLTAGGSVTEAIYDAGYGSSSRFYESIAPRLGLKPRTFTGGGKGEVILFSVGETSLGHVLVAATAKGICSIQFGDDPQSLVEEIQDRFPHAEFAGGDAGFDAVVAQVVGLIDQPHRTFDLPVHVRGTAFQHKVWQALRAIPLGETATYSDIAARIGNASAVRAVANACASNRVAVAIPCHRVVRSDGSLSGYRWGVERKSALLAKEAKA